MLTLKGVHFLLTYRCDLECDHCFVWGSPKSSGVFTLKQIRNILIEAKKLRTVECIAIEGGEPFLYYPVMVKTVEEAVQRGFRVEILSNCYWATCEEDATEWLKPMATSPSVELTLSSDLYHGESWETLVVRNAVNAANSLNMKVDVLAVKNSGKDAEPPREIEGAKVGSWEVMRKGRAALKLVEGTSRKNWSEFTKCPCEDFVKQERVHVDPLGYVHVCQGISIGNAWKKPFSEIINEYKPNGNPIIAPLLQGGPVALVEENGLAHEETYADACHMCYNARCALRSKYPEILAPSQMYGEF
jgi:MoaA/NifB/PqqE/SkfB family radical SAM enzyme